MRQGIERWLSCTYFGLGISFDSLERGQRERRFGLDETTTLVTHLVAFREYSLQGWHTFSQWRHQSNTTSANMDRLEHNNFRWFKQANVLWATLQLIPAQSVNDIRQGAFLSSNKTAHHYVDTDCVVRSTTNPRIVTFARTHDKAFIPCEAIIRTE